MAPIYQEIVLAWEGEEYTIHPDFDMVQRIESRGISIVGVCDRWQRGDPPQSQIARILSHMLQSGGAKTASPQRVYAHLAAHADGEEWLRIYTAIILAFIPQEPDSGKSGGPGDGADTKAETEELTTDTTAETTPA